MLCKFSGPLDESNMELITSLDSLICPNFCAGLRDKDETSHLVQHATMVGGYLQVLCSTSNMFAHVPESAHARTQENESSSLQHVLSLRWIFISRIRRLVDQLMTSIRLPYRSHITDRQAMIAYAACAVLQVEVEYFVNLLKQIPLAREVYFTSPYYLAVDVDSS
jgi:hypothetical protein